MTILFEPSRRETRPLSELLGGDVHAVSTLAELTGTLARHPGELLVVFGPGTDQREVCAFAAELRLTNPAIGSVLVRHKIDADLLGEAMRAGIREVARIEDRTGVREACARSLEISRHLAESAAFAPLEPKGAAHVTTVFSAKGGVGKTTAATNLAIALAAGGTRRVCLVDLDLAFGDIAITLQLAPEKSLADAVAMGDRLDHAGLRGLLTPYAPGIDAILAPAGPTDGEHVTRSLISTVVKVAAGMFDHVVIDTPPTINDQVLAALDASTQYVLLATPDIPALKSLRVTLDMFDLLRYPRENRFVVLNRADAKVGLTPSDIENALRVPISAHVPSSRDVPISVNKGIPIMAGTPAHPVSRAYRALALDHLGGVPEPVVEAPKSRWSRKPVAVAS